MKIFSAILVVVVLQSFVVAVQSCAVSEPNLDDLRTDFVIANAKDELNSTKLAQLFRC